MPGYRILAKPAPDPGDRHDQAQEAHRRRRRHLARRAHQQPVHRSLQAIHSRPAPAIRQAQVRDKVGRNVAELVTSPRAAKAGPAGALNLGQATAVLEKSQRSSLHAYVVVSLMTGIRTEEARELRWDHVVTRDGRRRALAAGHRGRLRSRGVRPLRLAFRPGGRRHQDREVTPHPDTARPRLRTRCARCTPARIPTARPPGHLAGPRPGVLHQGRHSPIGRQRPAILQHDHQSGQASAPLDTQGAAPLVRVHHERQRRAPRGHR